jgi:poly(3-hydroxybutyrate) depolymerase
MKATRFLAVLTAFMPFTPLSSAIAQQGGGEPVLKTARNHPMQYYLSLPKGWSATRKWPIVVTLSGAGKAWLSDARRFAQMRDARNYPFLIVTPLIITNGTRDPRQSSAYQYPAAVWDEIAGKGRCNFDTAGLRAVVGDVQQLYGGDKRYFLDGCSAGGHLAWATIFQQPENLLGAAPTSANYLGRCVTVELQQPVAFSNSPERIQLPVKVFEGAADPTLPILSEQAANAMTLAASLGYRNVTKTIVSGAGHCGMDDQVLDYFHSLLPRP